MSPVPSCIEEIYMETLQLQREEGGWPLQDGPAATFGAGSCTHFVPPIFGEATETLLASAFFSGLMG